MVRAELGVELTDLLSFICTTVKILDYRGRHMMVGFWEQRRHSLMLMMMMMMKCVRQ